MVPANIKTTYHKRFLKILRREGGREGEDLKGKEVFQKKFPFIRIASRFFGKLTIYNIDS